MDSLYNIHHTNSLSRDPKEQTLIIRLSYSQRGGQPLQPPPHQQPQQRFARTNSYNQIVLVREVDSLYNLYHANSLSKYSTEQTLINR